MDLFDRIYSLDHILRRSRYPVTLQALLEKLECSRATVNRIIRDMRVFLGAPIEYDKQAEGYCYSKDGEHPYELPGLWFNSSELHAILAAQRFLDAVQPGLLESHISPLRDRIEQILQSRHGGGGEIAGRVRILGMSCRSADPDHFKTSAGAVVQRRQLGIVYHGRTSNEVNDRIISPQRLVHYRDNWYLDAWDHKKRALRTFSIDRIKQLRVLNRKAKDIPDNRLDDHFASAYGIFAGKPRNTAVLRFSPERARWVADETWHPRQKSRFDGEHYLLEVPYADPRELIMDILKHGPEVEVLRPESLRTEVINCLNKALMRQQQVRLDTINEKSRKRITRRKK
jgi:predicted DNA-binding transcriptional regulator YafY